MTAWLTPTQDKALRDGLAALPELGALAATALPGEHLGSEGGARTVPGSRPPLNVAVLDLTRRSLPTAAPVAAAERARTEIAWVGGDGRARPDMGLAAGILTTLEGWTRLAEGEMLDAGRIEPGTLADHPTVDSECAWLLRRILWVLEQQWVVELADDVHRMVRGCRGILHERPEYKPSCPNCHGLLVEEASFWHCPDCGTDHRDDRMSLRTAVALQLPMTVGELVKAFGWSRDTINSWVTRGRLEPANEERPARYHVLDALRLADAGG